MICHNGTAYGCPTVLLTPPEKGWGGGRNGLAPPAGTLEILQALSPLRCVSGSSGQSGPIHGPRSPGTKRQGCLLSPRPGQPRNRPQQAGPDGILGQGCPCSGLPQRGAGPITGHRMSCLLLGLYGKHVCISHQQSENPTSIGRLRRTGNQQPSLLAGIKEG